MRKAIFSLLLILGLSAFGETIDFARTAGPVKPVHGVGQPPIRGGNDTELFHYLGEAGIPYSRLHDVGGAFGRNLFVDIPNIFRDFSANENKAENYDFAFTDSLLCALVRQGVEPYYRLGVTIENDCMIQAFRIFPPKNYVKWARICEHIIRHYNEGWANGYHMNISHWEIWNEPENFEDPMENQMWRSTFGEYMKLYGTVAPYLKKRFPDLKIGGYGSCGFYAVTGEGVVAANSSPRFAYFVECFEKFLTEARDKQWPLDFFSCHSYADPASALSQFNYARKKLDEYGFEKTELSVNEWLPAPNRAKLGTAQQASEIAAEIVGFQNGPVDDAEIYDARATGGIYGPLFEGATGKPYKAYYVFRAFNELRRLGTAVAMPSLPEGIYATGATDGKGRAALLVSNISGSTWVHGLDFPGMQVDSARVIDGHHDHFGCAAPDRFENHSVWLLYLSKQHPDPEPDLRITHRVAPADRRVGIAYSLWCDMGWWDDTWDFPAIGKYDSRDRSVIRHHAEQLSDAGVDFVWLDWSNNVRYDRDSLLLGRGHFARVEDATDILFDEYWKLDQKGLPHPLISIFIGTTGSPASLKDGALQRKADQVWEHYAGNPRYAGLMEMYRGKPLLVVYVDTPTPWPDGIPDWHDERFTVRWMTGYVSEQSWLRTPDRISKFGYWSWEDRGEQTYTVCEGEPESMVITASQREQVGADDWSSIPAVGRQNGATLRKQFARAREIGVHYGMVVSWNEWITSEQPSVEISKDLEPSVQLGDFYLRLLKQEVARFKSE